MLFNSLVFLVFFLTVFVLYWFVFARSIYKQNFLLLVASYVFYGWWDWRFLSLIVLSSAVDFQIGAQLPTARNPKRLLYLSLFVNLGVLGVFKYADFFANSFIDMLHTFGMKADPITLGIILPVGISFYTFQTLSYTIDVYKKRMKPTKDPLTFFVFVSFFPQLVAGPIERAKHLLPQFAKARVFHYDFASGGAKLILLGFFKKLVVADGSGALVDVVYTNPESYVGAPMVVATFLFTFQIYGDFSGYSDIAIGLSRILGFDLLNNFKRPYFARSLTDFWRRWHISLSSWFRDYLYIPLGGSRGSNFKTYRNLFFTFLVSGLWHGANWTFVVWGTIHGLILMIERSLGIAVHTSRFVVLRIFSTFVVVMIAWIFFRANTVGDAFYILTHMFSDIGIYGDFTALSMKFRGTGLQPIDLITTFSFIGVLFVMEWGFEHGWLTNNLKKPIWKWLFYWTILFFILFWGCDQSIDNFIYFQF